MKNKQTNKNQLRDLHREQSQVVRSNTWAATHGPCTFAALFHNNILLAAVDPRGLGRHTSKLMSRLTPKTYTQK